MDCEKVADTLVGWLREQVSAARCRGMVFGLSGGLDSAVVAGLGMRAIPDECLGVIMPCHSDPGDVQDAQLVASAFGLPVITYELGPAYDLHFANLSKLLSGYAHEEGKPVDVASKDTSAVPLGPTFDPSRARMAKANLKPRLRMTALYYFANMLNYLVVGTSNKSELTVGYFTKHGDGGSDLLPIGGMVKMHVRELAAYLGVPQPIIDKPPTAGLWSGQTDEGEMGMTYAELDRYILTGIAPDSVRDRVSCLNRAAQHKLSRPPIPNLTLD
ncbi:MAG: NAD(+) synthase [Clostridia bacterium]|nr:NAD(+) synthase [Clostridia bacterium]